MNQGRKPILPLFILQVTLGVFIKVLKWALFVGLIAVALFLVVVVLPKYHEYDDAAEAIIAKSTEADFKINEGSIIYASDNTVLANLYQNRNLEYLDFEDIPKTVINAFVSVEDQSFWNNNGVDFKGLVRVLFNFVRSRGGEVHGASTITQQLARTIYLTRDVNLNRKFTELLLATKMTEKYGKQKIMEYYVNDINYGGGIYGIAGAAKAYFNKDVNDLTLSETAYLCAIPNRPEYYNPKKNKDNAIPRRNKILNDMCSLGYITIEQRDKAKAEEIVLNFPESVFNDTESTFAIDCAIKALMKYNGFEFNYVHRSDNEYNEYTERYDEAYEAAKQQLYTGGFRIQTAIDNNAYLKAQAVIDENLSEFDDIYEDTGLYQMQGAITIMDNETHKVVAVVGGRSQEGIAAKGVYTFNRAYQAYRQPGSSFKPIAVYTPAMMNGYTPNSVVYNIDVEEAKDKTSEEIQEMWGTPWTIRDAVEQSQNGVAWKLFDELGPVTCLSYVTKMKFNKIVAGDYNDAVSLGGLSYGTTTVEMAGAYACLANHGIFYEPTCIVSIKDKNDKEYYIEDEVKQIYNPISADTMVDVMRGVLIRGTAQGINWNGISGLDAFAKTGTTNDYKDGWFCGATPYYTITVWVGCDKPVYVESLRGSTYPGGIWRDIMFALTEDKPEIKFDLNISSEINNTNTDYSWLDGRSDDEEMSAGYTVGNYKKDHDLAARVDRIIARMSLLDKDSTDYDYELDRLYNAGKDYINEIYGRRMTSETSAKLESAYKVAKNKGQYVGEADANTIERYEDIESNTDTKIIKNNTDTETIESTENTEIIESTENTESTETNTDVEINRNSESNEGV